MRLKGKILDIECTVRNEFQGTEFKDLGGEGVHRDSRRGGESDFPDLEFDLGFRVHGCFLFGVYRDSCGRGESVYPERVRG